MTHKVATVLVCPAELLREGIARVLDGNHFDVIAAGGSLEGVTALAGSKLPVLAVLAVNEGEALAWCREIFAKFPGIRIAVLADGLTRRGLDLMQDYGVGGFLHPAISRESLLKSLDLILDGICLLSSLLNESTSAPGSEPAPEVPAGGNGSRTERMPSMECLSHRELEVLDALAEGAPNKIIARGLGITDATVKLHVKSILRKTKMSNRVQLAVWAANRVAQLPSQQTAVVEFPQSRNTLPPGALRPSRHTINDPKGSQSLQSTQAEFLAGHQMRAMSEPDDGWVRRRGAAQHLAPVTAPAPP